MRTVRLHKKRDSAYSIVYTACPWQEHVLPAPCHRSVKERRRWAFAKPAEAACPMGVRLAQRVELARGWLQRVQRPGQYPVPAPFPVPLQVLCQAPCLPRCQQLAPVLPPMSPARSPTWWVPLRESCFWWSIPLKRIDLFAFMPSSRSIKTNWRKWKYKK